MLPRTEPLAFAIFGCAYFLNCGCDTKSAVSETVQQEERIGPQHVGSYKNSVVLFNANGQILKVIYGGRQLVNVNSISEFDNVNRVQAELEGRNGPFRAVTGDINISRINSRRVVIRLSNANKIDDCRVEKQYITEHIEIDQSIMDSVTRDICK